MPIVGKIQSSGQFPLLIKVEDDQHLQVDSQITQSKSPNLPEGAEPTLAMADKVQDGLAVLKDSIQTLTHKVYGALKNNQSEEWSLALVLKRKTTTFLFTIGRSQQCFKNQSHLEKTQRQTD